MEAKMREQGHTPAYVANRKFQREFNQKIYDQYKELIGEEHDGQIFLFLDMVETFGQEGFTVDEMVFLMKSYGLYKADTGIEIIINDLSSRIGFTWDEKMQLWLYESPFKVQ